MNLPSLNVRGRNNAAKAAGAGLTLDDHDELSRLAQRQADKWLISGSILIGTAALGIFGLPLFLRGVWLLRRAQQDGLSVRPMLVTLLGYLVIIDAAINTVGWALDMFANHTLLARVLLTGWGNMFDAGYFWHFNELWIGGAAGPGEKGWEIGLIFTVFTMRIAAAIGFLQMKRWGHQWMIVTCWIGVVIWCGYVFNMTMYADVRFAGVVLPVIGWWLYDIFYIAPFLAIPYLHSVNRESSPTEQVYIMTTSVKHTSREARRLQTRQRILGAAVAEFKRSGMAGADVGAIVAAAGVAHGTFFFHFPTNTWCSNWRLRGSQQDIKPGGAGHHARGIGSDRRPQPGGPMTSSSVTSKEV